MWRYTAANTGINLLEHRAVVWEGAYVMTGTAVALVVNVNGTTMYNVLAAPVEATTRKDRPDGNETRVASALAEAERMYVSNPIALRALATATAVVFDKTGVLSPNRIEVVSWTCPANHDQSKDLDEAMTFKTYVRNLYGTATNASFASSGGGGGGGGGGGDVGDVGDGGDGGGAAAEEPLGMVPPTSETILRLVAGGKYTKSQALKALLDAAKNGTPGDDGARALLEAGGSGGASEGSASAAMIWRAVEALLGPRTNLKVSEWLRES